MKRMLKAGLAFLILIFCMVLLFLSRSNKSLAADATSVPTLPYFATPTPQPACPPSCEHLKTDGNYFILKLKFPYQKEATLTTDQIKKQRAKIRVMQNEVTKTLTLTGGVVGISYDAVPYILFYGLDKTIKALSKHPLVEAIYLDSPMNEAFSMGLETVPQITGEMLDAAYGKPLPSFLSRDDTQRCFVIGIENFGSNLGACEYVIKRTEKNGHVTLFVFFRLPRLYQSSLSDTEFGSLQNAVVRQISYSFLLAMRHYRVTEVHANVDFWGIYVDTDAEGVEAILKLPMVDGIRDDTGS